MGRTQVLRYGLERFWDQVGSEGVCVCGGACCQLKQLAVLTVHELCIRPQECAEAVNDHTRLGPVPCCPVRTGKLRFCVLCKWIDRRGETSGTSYKGGT